MNTNFTEKEIEGLLKEINDDDLRKMFSTSVVSFIKNKPEELIVKELIKYLEYEVPVNIGDIVKIKNNTYVVTCVYTDNSVDLLGESAKKENKGLYNVEVTKVGKLQRITV